MKSWFVVIAIVYLLFFSVSMHAETANSDEAIVVTEDFEDAPPPGWEWLTPGAVATLEGDDKVFHGGKQSILIHNETSAEPEHYAAIIKYLNLKPNTNYKMSLWIKADEASQCWFGGGKKWQFRQGISDGTYDWKQVETVFFTDESGDGFPIIINSGDVTKALWLDDLTVTEISPREL